MRPVNETTFKVLLEMVKGTFKKAVRERSRLEKNTAVLFWRNKNKLSVNSKDVLFYENKKVVVQRDVQGMVNKCRRLMKGGGARSVAYNLKGKYEGVSERRIRKVLDKSQSHGEVQAKFNNIPPIKFVKAKNVFERVQIDLVSMAEVESEGKKFKYILTAVDVFSRFLFCRPLQNKRAEQVAKVVKELFDEHGWPQIVQCDNGPEFLGNVDRLFRRKNIKVIKGRSYHPQSQGKVERQNSIIRKKIRHEICRRGRRGFNWIEELQEVQLSINLQPKEVLGYQTPFSVYFGRGREKTADEIRNKAADASDKCNRRTFASRLRKNECSVYERGALVLVKYPFGKRVPHIRYILKGKILKRERGFSRYKVSFRKPDGSLLVQWVAVENLTSRTLDEEKRRKAKAYALFQKKERNRQHREKYYLTLEGECDVPSLSSERHQSCSDIEDTEDSQRRFAGNEHIRILVDPREAGNCQFIAVSDQLKAVDIHRSGMQLRQLAINHIEKNKSHYVRFVSGSIDMYLKKMSRRATFGDNITLIALARELNCQFIVINSQGQRYHRVDSNTGVFDRDMTTFTLGFYPEIHYVSVAVSDRVTRQEIVDCCCSTDVIRDVNSESEDEAEEVQGNKENAENDNDRRNDDDEDEEERDEENAENNDLNNCSERDNDVKGNKDYKDGVNGDDDSDGKSNDDDTDYDDQDSKNVKGSVDDEDDSFNEKSDNNNIKDDDDDDDEEENNDDKISTGDDDDSVDGKSNDDKTDSDSEGKRDDKKYIDHDDDSLNKKSDDDDTDYDDEDIKHVKGSVDDEDVSINEKSDYNNNKDDDGDEIKDDTVSTGNDDDSVDGKSNDDNTDSDGKGKRDDKKSIDDDVDSLDRKSDDDNTDYDDDDIEHVKGSVDDEDVSIDENSDDNNDKDDEEEIKDDKISTDDDDDSVDGKSNDDDAESDDEGKRYDKKSIEDDDDSLDGKSDNDVTDDDDKDNKNVKGSVEDEDDSLNEKSDDDNDKDDDEDGNKDDTISSDDDDDSNDGKSNDNDTDSDDEAKRDDRKSIDDDNDSLDGKSDDDDRAYDDKDNTNVKGSVGGEDDSVDEKSYDDDTDSEEVGNETDKKSIDGDVDSLDGKSDDDETGNDGERNGKEYPIDDDDESVGGMSDNDRNDGAHNMIIQEADVAGVERYNNDRVAAAHEDDRNDGVDIENENVSDNVKRGVVNSLMAEQKKSIIDGTEVVFTDERIKSNVLELISTGIQSISSLITSTLLCLLDNTDYQDRLFEELDRVFGKDGVPSLSDRENCPLLEALELETHRYVTIVPLLPPRTSTEDVNIYDYDIPEGTLVTGNIWHAHHNQKVWHDPWNFRPQRFLDNDGHLLPIQHHVRKSLMPFGVGRRQCPGRPLTRSVYFLYMAALLRRWKLIGPVGEYEPCDPKRMDNFDTTTFPFIQPKPFYCSTERRYSD